MNDSQFEISFADCSLPENEFTHRAHVRLAWIHINKYGEEKAIENIVNQLQAYTKSVGAEKKFHMTLTIAAVKAVAHFMKKSNTTNFESFIIENSLLLTDFIGLMESHYGENIFKIPGARENWIAPKLDPFN